MFPNRLESPVRFYFGNYAEGLKYKVIHSDKKVLNPLIFIKVLSSPICLLGRSTVNSYFVFCFKTNA